MSSIIFSKKALAEGAEAENPIFVFMRHPIGDTVSGSQIWKDIDHDDKLYRTLAEYPQVVLFTGHTHWTMTSGNNFVNRGFYMLNTSSVRDVYNERDERIMPSVLSQGNVIEVHSGSVRVRGREFSKRQWIEATDYTLTFHGSAVELKAEDKGVRK